ncbi:MAG: hypothetical protein AVDCRST_MAG19-3346 [uncultured Thermomicrobiales bacterium]|uniref:Uncharacterized protein n=1 Tax=uncultured Thermomicrobiales bacterium TaxID=1645740 RepID=A0A6J4VDW0_9BACT|nr:MAG: hypothetical protein AVDCRST_MAG19-3346 [uncultured Thermomicrobiales bacterium]
MRHRSPPGLGPLDRPATRRMGRGRPENAIRATLARIGPVGEGGEGADRGRSAPVRGRREGGRAVAGGTTSERHPTEDGGGAERMVIDSGTPGPQMMRGAVAPRHGGDRRDRGFGRPENRIGVRSPASSRTNAVRSGSPWSSYAAGSSPTSGGGPDGPGTGRPSWPPGRVGPPSAAPIETIVSGPASVATFTACAARRGAASAEVRETAAPRTGRGVSTSTQWRVVCG